VVVTVAVMAEFLLGMFLLDFPVFGFGDSCECSRMEGHALRAPF